MAEKIIQLRDINTGVKIFPKTYKAGILDLEIDQEFDGTSEMPQSGKAIKEALANVAFTGNFDDLSNKPNPQVQSNWNDTDTESPAYIQNKPDVPDAFWITYAVTTYEEITTALEANKLVMCNYGGSAYSYYTKEDDDSYVFTLIGKSGTEVLCNFIVCTTENIWTINTMSTSFSQTQANWNDTDAESPAYIQNKPTIGNGTITFMQGDVLKGTITSNQSGDTIIDLDAGGTVDQTYDSTSENAQSGVAVAEALTNYSNKDLSNLSAVGEAHFVKSNIAVTHTANTSVGSSTNPVYVNSSGVATACSIHTIIATYSSGTSWYRIYSDGWCEQGGLYYKGSSLQGTNQISFIRAFKDTNYNFLALMLMNTSGAIGFGSLVEDYTARTKDSTSVRVTSQNYGYAWKVSGYIN